MNSAGISIYYIHPGDGAARYVGMTSQSLENRLRGHQKNSSGKLYRHCWMRSVLNSGGELHIELLEFFPGAKDKRWIEAERFWIAYFRFLGCDLTNLDLGGRGNGTHSQITLEKLRASVNKSFQTPHRKRILASKEYRLKLSAAGKKAMGSEEARRAVSIRSRILMSDPKEREHLSRIMKAKWADPKFKEAMALLAPNQTTPEFRKRMSDIVSKSYENPELLARLPAIRRSARLKYKRPALQLNPAEGLEDQDVT